MKLVFVPSETKVIREDLEKAREISIDSIELDVPVLHPLSFAILIAEGCEACPLAIASIDALAKSMPSIVDTLYIVDCSASGLSGGAADLCDRASVLPTTIVSSSSEIEKILGEGRGRASMLLGVGMPIDAALADLVLSAYIALNEEVAKNIVSKVFSKARELGLAPIPSILLVKKFIVKQIELVKKFGEPRCPCAPSKPCPCPDAVVAAQRLGKCVCGFFTTKERAAKVSQEVAEARNRIMPLMRAINSLVKAANGIVVSLDVEALMRRSTTSPDLAIELLSNPTITHLMTMNEAIYNLNAIANSKQWSAIEESILRVLEAESSNVVKKRSEGG